MTEVYKEVDKDNKHPYIKIIMEENQKLKNEIADINKRLGEIQTHVLKKKKAILNEICNFVNTKN